MTQVFARINLVRYDRGMGLRYYIYVLLKCLCDESVIVFPE